MGTGSADGLMERVFKRDVGAGSLLAAAGRATCSPKCWVLVQLGVVERTPARGGDE